jgi:DNA-binding NtrC family response regulator
MTTVPAGCSVVLVEDDAVFGQALMQRLRLARVTTHWARTAAEGATLLRRHRPTLVLCDIRLPDGDGEALIARLMPELGGVPVVAMTAHGAMDQAVRLLRAGADDYLAKPFPVTRIFEKLAAFARRGIPPGTEEPGDPAADAPGWRSPPLRALHAALERVGPAAAPVLFLGESGGGGAALWPGRHPWPAGSRRRWHAAAG